LGDDVTEPGPPKIAVLERNKVVGQRIARVVSAGAGFAPVFLTDDPGTVRQELAPDATLLACDASDLDFALDLVSGPLPGLRLITWCSDRTQPIIEAALRSPNLSNIIGWPSYQSMPRPWELTMAVHGLVQPQVVGPRLADLFSWGSTVLKWRPRTSQERDHVVAEVATWAQRAGALRRTAERISELAHEMLMNAMYDAPRDENGLPRYALDRKQEVSLAEGEVPTLRMGSDGIHVGLEVSDPFGALTRQQVLEGISRGQGASSAEDTAAILDTSHGGAGLGLFRIYSASAVLVADITRGVTTRVLSLYDLDVNPRQFRALPGSLHLFERG
jgi:hypothetical protein